MTTLHNTFLNYWNIYFIPHFRDHSGYGLGQWEKVLHSNSSKALLCNTLSHWPSPYPVASSHWLSPYPEWSLHFYSSPESHHSSDVMWFVLIPTILRASEFISLPTMCVAYRADSRCVPSQWETSLQSNAVSYWLSGELESALAYCLLFQTYLLWKCVKNNCVHQQTYWLTFLICL